MLYRCVQSLYIYKSSLISYKFLFLSKLIDELDDYFVCCLMCNLLEIFVLYYDLVHSINNVKDSQVEIDSLLED